MLRMIGLLIKITLFSLLVLILGNWIHWHGKSISDQIKTQLSSAEHLGSSALRNFSDREPRRHPISIGQGRSSAEKPADSISEANVPEQLHSSERQKLRALIRELNSSL